MVACSNWSANLECTNQFAKHFDSYFNDYKIKYGYEFWQKKDREKCN